MPPGKPSVVISSAWDLGLLSSQLKYMGPSSEKGKSLVEQIRVLLHSHQPFEDLRASPVLPSGSPRNVDSPVTTRALQCLTALEFILHLPEESFKLIANDLAEGCLREFWDSIVAWIRYSHSGFHSPVLGLGRKRVDMAPLVSVLASLFQRAKVLVPDLFARAPEMYGILADLWLHLDMYVRGDGLVATMDDLGRSYINHAVWASGVQTAEYFSWEEGDFNAIDGMRWAVRDHTRYFYRRMISHTRRCLDGLRKAEFKRADTHYGCLHNQLTAVTSFVVHLLPMSCMPRDVVRDLVDIMRILHSAPPARALAEVACDTLAMVWQHTADQRALLWSLHDGAFPLVMSLYHSEEPSTRVGNALGTIALLSVFGAVQRVLPRDMSFLDEFPDGPGRYAQRRADVARPIYKKTCAYCAISLPICTSHLSQPQGKISTRDAHFLKACGNDYLSKNLARILGEISDGLERHREHLALPPRVHIEIRIGGRFDEDAHENRVNIRREDSEERSAAEPFAGNDPEEPTVLVVAVLLRIDKIAGAVVVRRAMLRELKEEAGRLTE
ncbi:hypothetical protein EV715DRAFT_204560 [Schizophyllum commune]